MNEADFELLEIDISKEILPDNIHAIHATEINKYGWKLAWGFGFEKYHQEGYELVRVFINFSLVKDDNEYAEPLVYAEIENTFKVTAGLKTADKALILEIFFNITIGNMQGFFAAKFEGTPMVNAIPPNAYGDFYTQQFLIIAQDEWQI